MDLIFKSLLWAAAAYILIIAALYLFQRNLIYFPERSKPDIAKSGVSGMMEFSVVTGDGINLTGWYMPARPGKPTIALFHGNAQNHAYRTYKSLEYIKAGYGVLLAGYRGYGGNEGKASEQGFYSDARAYLAQLKTLHISDKNLIIYGESIGSGVAVQMASEYPETKALVLESPYTSTVDVGAKQFFFAPVRLMMKDRYESIKKIKGFKGKTIVVHGRADKIIPFNFGQQLYEAANSPKKMIVYENAGHNDLYQYGAAADILAALGEAK